MKSGITILTTVEFTFSSARRITGGPERIDGHNYLLRVSVRDMGPDSVQKAGTTVQKAVLAKLDHIILDDCMSETDIHSLSRWIWDQLEGTLEGLHEIRVQEKRGQWVTVLGSDS